MEKESIAYWRRLLDQLPQRDHLSLVLRAAGYSYKEMAGILEVDAEYVGVILSRAKSRLKKLHDARRKEEQG
jgi:DNA-directed RNA polymerase specialized sigma24 family protein